MSTRSLPRFLLTATFVWSGALAQACSSDSASDIAISDVVREGGATTQELRQVLATPGDDWSWAGGEFDEPSAATPILPRDSPFTFSWHAASTESTDAGAPNQSESAYLLVFNTASKPRLLRVFTTLSEYTPDARAWQKLLSVGEPIDVSLTTTTFEGSALSADGGPHAGQTLTFRLD